MVFIDASAVFELLLSCPTQNKQQQKSLILFCKGTFHHIAAGNIPCWTLLQRSLSKKNTGDSDRGDWCQYAASILHYCNGQCPH